jgi:hypothetical protein
MSTDKAKTSEVAKVMEDGEPRAETVERKSGSTRIVCAHEGCGLVIDVVEAPEKDELVEQILKKSVNNRPESLYKCGNGHDGELRSI